MKSIKIVISILCLTISIFAADHAALGNLTGDGLTDGEIATLSNALRTALVKTGAFDMMERSQIDEILKEQGFQSSGACNDASCIVEIGQLLSVKYMFLGNIGKIGETYSVSVRQIDVATGKVINDVIENYKGPIDNLLTVIIPSVAKQMTTELAIDNSEKDTKPVFTTADTKKEKQRKIGISLDIAGLAAIAGGTALFVMSRSDLDEAAAIQSSTSTFIPESRSKGSDDSSNYQDKIDSANLKRDLAIALWGVGAVALGIGLVFTF